MDDTSTTTDDPAPALSPILAADLLAEQYRLAPRGTVRHPGTRSLAQLLADRAKAFTEELAPDRAAA